MEQREAFFWFFVQLLIPDSKRKASVPGTNQPPLLLVSNRAFRERDKCAEQWGGQELSWNNAACRTEITGYPSAGTRLVLITRRTRRRNTEFIRQGFQSNFKYNCIEFLKEEVSGSKGIRSPTSVIREDLFRK